MLPRHHLLPTLVHYDHLKATILGNKQYLTRAVYINWSLYPNLLLFSHIRAEKTKKKTSCSPNSLT